jgi:hypothetical protein
MHPPTLVSKTLGSLLLVACLVRLTPEAMSADLQPKTLEAFERSVGLTETRIERELKTPGKFLYVEGLH